MRKITVSIEEIPTGWRWRVTSLNADGAYIRESMGKQQTPLAQSVRQEGLHEALWLLIRDAMGRGELPYLIPLTEE